MAGSCWKSESSPASSAAFIDAPLTNIGKVRSGPTTVPVVQICRRDNLCGERCLRSGSLRLRYLVRRIKLAERGVQRRQLTATANTHCLGSVGRRWTDLRWETRCAIEWLQDSTKQRPSTAMCRTVASQEIAAHRPLRGHNKFQIPLWNYMVGGRQRKKIIVTRQDHRASFPNSVVVTGRVEPSPGNPTPGSSEPGGMTLRCFPERFVREQKK